MTQAANFKGGLLVLTIISILAGFFVFSRTQSPQPVYAQGLFAASNNDDPLHPVETFSVDSSARTVTAAFAQAGKDFYPEDEVTAFPEPSLGLGSVITVRRALPVTVQDGKKKYAVRTWQDTVEGVLNEKKLELGDEDRIAPGLATALGPNLVITITRVARTQVSEFEVIKYESLEQDDPTMYRPERKVTQEGKNGKREKKFLLIREDGELVSKTLISNTIVEQAVKKITKVGTKLKIGKTLTGKSTWYDCCGTKVASDDFKRGTEIRVTNLSNGKSIIVKVDGCICGAKGVLVDLHPSLFQQLGGTLGQGVMASVRVEEILN